MPLWAVILVGVAVFGLSAGGVELVRRWAQRERILDVPGERSSHTAPTPRGGGLAIVLVSLLAMAVIGLSTHWPVGSQLIWLVLGIAIVAVVSWLDDVRSLHTAVRLGAHVLAAAVAVAGIGWWARVDLPFVPRLFLGSVGAVITALWIVGLTNAYNFMDGIDGIAGGQAVVAGLGWFALGGEPSVRLLGLVVAAAGLGFLIHNWQPAKIFMGDVGSAFLGYVFAVIAIGAAHRDPRLALVGPLLVWPFVFDTAFTFLRRLGRGENVFQAHRSHLYQRLVIAGHSHRFVSLLYIGLASYGVGLAALWLRGGDWAGLAVIVGLAAGACGLWAFVRAVERKRERASRVLTPATAPDRAG